MQVQQTTSAARHQRHASRLVRRPPAAWRAPGPCLNRLTGLGLTLCLFLRLVVLGTLLPGTRRAGMTSSTWPGNNRYSLALDVLLIFGILFHSLSGIQVALR